ncbi:MAG: hemin uptake protein HemP [Burkholderiales bacterium]|nr:hemin uptake protein HemP [Burkholderiales bacterium]
MSHTDTSTITPPPATPPVSGAAPEINSLRLLGEQGLLRIAHKGAVYTLRTTSKGGLILTK